MAFQFKSFQMILKDMVAKFLSSTGVNDINPGSVLSTFLEAASQEDAQQFFQMFQIIRNYNLDTTEGTDLDNRAAEFGLTRLTAQKSTGIVTISDSSIVPRKTKIYAGDRGPVAGQTYVKVDNAGGYDPSGTIIVGRPTDHTETLPYSSIVNFGNFFQINLVGSFANDHGTDETVIQAQGGDRVVQAGSVVRVPASDISSEISFVLSSTATIFDGESTVDNVAIVAVVPGAQRIPAGTIIEFDTKPFTTAEVTNPFSITNGSDRESDVDLRSRIKSVIQGLSKGTKAAILAGVTGVSSTEDNKRVVSANVIEPVTLDELAFLFIDDGTGLEPSSAGVGNEVLLESATGGEKFLQLDEFPVIKAQIETQNSQPFPILNGDTLVLSVNGKEETLTFGPDDFTILGAATAYEVARAINTRLSLVEARTSNTGSKVTMRAKAMINETIKAVGGTANSSNKLFFPTDITDTIALYKYDGSSLIPLSKDGNSASLESSSSAPFNLSGTETLTVVIDGKTANPQTITFQVGDFQLAGSATAAEVAARINLELSGAVASVTSSGNKVTITSNIVADNSSKVHVTGGTANAGILDFSTVEVEGVDKGFSLNRFSGQIELAQVAATGDKYETASVLTRGFIVSDNAQPYDLTNGDTIVISVDGGANKTATLNTADFSNIDAATAQEIADVINSDVSGAHAEATPDGRVLVRTNTWDEAIGSIEIVSVTGTANAIGFEIGVQHDSIAPHVASVVSTSSENYSFSPDESLTIVVDKTPTNNTFVVTMDLDGTVTIGDASAPFTTFIADITAISQNFNLKFLNDSDLVDFKINWLTGTNAPAVSTVSAYNATTGQFTLSAGLGASIDAGDTFTILPSTAENVATYMSNTVVSSLSFKANIEAVDNGTKVQIASKIAGTDGSIQVTGGTANTVLNFSTSQIEGVDGYKHYTGLLEKVQHVVDGLDTDLVNFPGVKAAGVQIEVLPPIVRLLSFEINLTLNGVTSSTIHDKAINAVSSYVNSLGVGQDVILNEIVDNLMSVDGVVDVEFITPTANIAIADSEIARVAENNIIIG